MTNITQVVSPIPPAGHRGIDSRDIFVTKQEAFQDHLYGSTVAELNTVATQLNTLANEVEAIANEVEAIGEDVVAVEASISPHYDNINAVVANATNINAVVANATNINAVATNEDNINAVVANATNINAVVANATNINAVATNEDNINAVATNMPKITSVDTNMSDIVLVSDAIQAGTLPTIINDSAISTTSTWSSDKLNDEITTAIGGIDLSSKQDTLVSGTNIKTVNGESILGEGNISLPLGVVADYQEFTTSGTWTKPDGCNYVYVEAWGAGQAAAASGGGTGGFFSNALLTASDVPTSVMVTIGAGGSTRYGEHGGNSKFGNLVCGFGSGVASSSVSSNNVMNGGTGGSIKYFRDGTSETPTSQLSSSKMLLGGGGGDGTGYGQMYVSEEFVQYLHIDTQNSFIYSGYMYTPVLNGWYLIKTEINNINIVLDTIYLGIQSNGQYRYNYKVINSDLFIFRPGYSEVGTGTSLYYYKADLSTISSGSITLETKVFTNTHSGNVPQTASIELYNDWYYIVCANTRGTSSIPHYAIFKTQDFINYTRVKVASSTTSTGVMFGDIGSNTNGIYFTYTLNASNIGNDTIVQCVTSDATATTWTNLSTSLAGSRPSKFIVRDNGEIVFACLYYSSGFKMRFCIINSSLTTVTNIQYGATLSPSSGHLCITKLDNGEIHACTILGQYNTTSGTHIFKLLTSNTIALYSFQATYFDFQFPIYGNTTHINGISRTADASKSSSYTYAVRTITDSGSAYNNSDNIGFDYTAIPRSKKFAPFFTGGGDGGIAAGGGQTASMGNYYVKFQDNPVNIAKGGDGLVRVWTW